MKCGICGADALFVCRQCGRDMCRAHYSHYTGRCPECEGTLKPEPKKVTARQKAKRSK